MFVSLLLSGVLEEKLCLLFMNQERIVTEDSCTVGRHLFLLQFLFYDENYSYVSKDLALSQKEEKEIKKKQTATNSRWPGLGSTGFNITEDFFSISSHPSLGGSVPLLGTIT